MNIKCTLCFCILFLFKVSFGQELPVWTQLPSLPDREGFAGMFAGVSKGNLFCLGGANFPDKRPWQGGIKKWYDGIYMFSDSGWTKLPDKINLPLAYGVTVNYRDRFIIAGGSSGAHHTTVVVAYTWNGKKLIAENYPALPMPLANMAGTLVGNLMIVAGGNSAPDGPPLNSCWGLDLADYKKGWFQLPPIPGPGRSMPVCAAYGGSFYVFSGENAGISNAGAKYRNILQDAYLFTPEKKANRWTGTWKALSPMPQGTCAAGSPIPVFGKGQLFFWGGVDAVTALYKDPSTHKGLRKELLVYDAPTDTWKWLGTKQDIEARVTLPVVSWNNRWVYISGEVKPGIRTNTVYSIQ